MIKRSFAMIQDVLSAYGFDKDKTTVQPFGTGLINNTWKLTANNKSYILQRINNFVFKQPEDIAFNIRLIGDHLHQNYPDYLFVRPLLSASSDDLIFIEEDNYFRLFPFIEGSHTIQVVQNPEQAYEAAGQFGRFTKQLSGLDNKKLKITIPGFHDLSLRYKQFTDVLKAGNKERMDEASDLIKAVSDHWDIIKTYERLNTDPSFHLRVTHHDTKISNVLFDENDQGLCLIDLDTVMPGYFISDVGDMMRTCLSPANEEEIDLDKIEVREDFYKAIVQGYADEMKDELTETEKNHFFYAGKFMIYMQALRFVTDYLNDDIYYGEKFPGHNLMRAKNQFTLLQYLIEKEALLAKKV